MGRGRGRGRGGGGGGGRGGGSRFGLKRRPQFTDKKEATHLKQFGESHPSNDNFDDFGPGASKKSKKNFSGQQDSRLTSDKFHQNRSDNEDTSDSESDEETTPYTELINLFSGTKQSKQVQIVSESEEEEEEEEENDSDQLEDTTKDDGSDGSDNDSENKEDDDVSEDSSTEDLESQDPKQPSSKKADVDKNITNMKVDALKDDEDDGKNDLEELEEETVIGDAEIDPEANDETSSADPFLLHFERELPENLQTVLKAKGKLYSVQTKIPFPILNQVHYSGIDDSCFKGCKEKQSSIVDKSDISSLERKRKIVPIPKSPSPSKSALSINNLHLKSQLVSRIGIANQASLDNQSCPGPLTPLQCELVYLASQYNDVYYPERTMENQDEIRMAYCVHAANHILKTRTRILHHNAKMASKVEVPEEYRDQGFVRPKVLILVPFKESALRIVKLLISLILEDEKGNVVNKKRFVDEYGGQTLFMPKTNPKPEDYMATFAGNVDDNFRLGMSITKKTIKLFTDFYSSDIIIASPLGLRIIIGAEGEKGRDYDFLSSIEVTILDQADVFLMQSWDHVIHLFKHLHLQPVTTHGTDFGRIRPWALDGLTKHYSQTLVFSSVNCVELTAIFSRHCRNFGGMVKVLNPILKGSICQVTVQLPQVYQQFDCSSLLTMNDARFDYFIKKVLPNFTSRLMTQTLIFVSSYFDFVRLRNHFKREELSFVQICEYTKDKKISRSRDLFFHNENHFLLYTERAMFFRRLRLKGIGHIIFYQLPQYPQLYSELCNFVREDFQSRRVKQRKNSSVTAIYCQYDAPRLASIVGSDRATHMLSSDKKVHAFVTGEFS